VRWWIIGGFFVVTFLVYGASLTNAFVRFDDGLLIYENPAIRSITPRTLWTIFTSYDPELYIPLTFLSYQLDYLIGGTTPTIYHIQNLLWHTCNALLVAWLMLLLTRKSWIALFGGLLFAVHPLHTEAVAWASARKDVLSTFFFLASLIAYLTYRGGNRRAYWWSLLTFLLGLLAKVTVLTLPVVLLLLDFVQNRPFTRRALAEKIPFFLLSALFAIIAWIGKTQVLGSSTLAEKLLMAPRGAMFYLEKIFAPVDLSVLYPFSGAVTLARPDIAVSLAIFVLLTLASLILIRWTRNIVFGIGFFFVTVSPTLLNFAKGDTFYFASDRYAYVPSIGIFFLFALGLARLCSEHLKRPCITAACLLLAGLAVVAALQAQTWKNTETLFRQALRVSPQSYVAHVNLGNVERYRGDAAKAITAYREALAILKREGRPGSALARSESKILSNLASAEREQGDLTTARSTFEEALRLNPGNVYALLGLGIVAGQQGNTAEAEQFYRKAILAAPDFAPAHLNLGALLVGMGRLEPGVAAYRTALDFNPFFPQAHFNLGVALTKLDRTEEAETAYREAVRLQPKFTAARLNLGILLYNKRSLEEAAAEFEAILEYDPKNAQAQSALRQMRGL